MPIANGLREEKYMQEKTIRISWPFASRKEDIRALGCALFAALLIYLLVASGLNLNLFAPSKYDNYTLQAMTWRQGRVSIDHDYPAMELAFYNDKIFVSFPPFPTLIMLPLTFFFGMDTPSMLINMLLLLGSCAMSYCLMRRLKLSPLHAAAMAVFCVCGCNLLEVSEYGGVWNVAQGTAFFLTTTCFFLMNDPRDDARLPMVLGPLMIAFAVGCRPFQAVYVPWVLYRLYQRCAKKERRGVAHTLIAMIPYVILPGLVAVAYGAYNYVRFDNPFEFGHNYLPEFSTEGGIQFSLSHWPKNLRNILRWPYYEGNRLLFPKFFGFAFYLANPLFLMVTFELIRRARGRALDAEDFLLLGTAFVHFNLLLMHRTFGGYQFGTRYLLDTMPSLLFFLFRKKRGLTALDALLMIWGVAFNAYGAVAFHLAM